MQTFPSGFHKLVADKTLKILHLLVKKVVCYISVNDWIVFFFFFYCTEYWNIYWYWRSLDNFYESLPLIYCIIMKWSKNGKMETNSHDLLFYALNIMLAKGDFSNKTNVSKQNKRLIRSWIFASIIYANTKMLGTTSCLRDPMKLKFPFLGTKYCWQKPRCKKMSPPLKFLLSLKSFWWLYLILTFE